MAAAQIFDHRDVQPGAEADEVGERGTLGEPFDPEIRGMHAENQRRPLADRGGVVGEPRLVRGAHFAQDRPGLRHHVGDSEAAADLDQLAARDDDLPAGGERRQDDHRRRRVVVDHDGGFGAGQPAEQTLGMDVAAPADPCRQVVFERRVAGCDLARADRPRLRQAARVRGWCAARRRWR